jgi:hypothetical protein
MDGKHCNSQLAGAIGKTANDLSSESIFPSALVDLRDEVALYPTLTPRYLKQALDRSGTTAETGIAVESQVNGATIDFRVKIRTTRTGTYRFFAFIVEDRIRSGQATHDDDGKVVYINYVHDNIGTYVIPNADPRTGVAMDALRPGQEAVLTFSIDTKAINAKRTVRLSDCRIVGYTLKAGGNGYVPDNVVSCPVDGSVRYVYRQ